MGPSSPSQGVERDRLWQRHFEGISSSLTVSHFGQTSVLAVSHELSPSVPSPSGVGDSRA